MSGGQVYVDMKLRITTYGSHNGIIVHSGIQHAKQSAPAIWPYAIYPPQSAVPNVQFPTTPLPIQDAPAQPPPQATIQEIPATSQKEPTPPASPVYSFDVPDSPPNEFIEPDRVQLNVFRVDSAEIPDLQGRRPETDRLPYVEQPPDIHHREATASPVITQFPVHYGSSHSLNYLYPGTSEIGRKQEATMPPTYDYGRHSEHRYGDKATSSQPHSYADEQLPAVSQSYASPTSPRHHKYAPYDDGTRHSQHPPRSSLQHHRRLSAQEWDDEQRQFWDHRRSLERGRSRESRKHYGSLPNRTQQDSGNEWRFRRDGRRPPPRDAPSEEIFHLYQTRDAFGNIRYICNDDFDESEIGMKLADSNAYEVPRTMPQAQMPSIPYVPPRPQMYQTPQMPLMPQMAQVPEMGEATSVVEETRTEEWRRNLDNDFGRQYTLDFMYASTPSYPTLPKYSELDNVTSRLKTQTFVEEKEEDEKAPETPIIAEEHVNVKHPPPVFDETFEEKKSEAADTSVPESEPSTSKETAYIVESPAPTPSPSVIDLTAVPAKPILQSFRRASKRGSHRKSVRFPPSEPKVTLDEHRLVITELNYDDEEQKKETTGITGIETIF